MFQVYECECGCSYACGIIRKKTPAFVNVNLADFDNQLYNHRPKTGCPKCGSETDSTLLWSKET